MSQKKTRLSMLLRRQGLFEARFRFANKMNTHSGKLKPKGRLTSFRTESCDIRSLLLVGLSLRVVTLWIGVGCCPG